MSEQPRRSREWEHWPSERKLDDGIRHRLRGLFHPTTHGDEAIEELITLHGRELEQRAMELAETITDLERREHRTHELRSAVEQMLRRGSAELDERHAELTELAARLAERETVVAEAEEALAERRRELGAVELRRAAIERRDAAVAEREETLTRRAAELAEREQQVADVEQRADELVARSTEVAVREAHLTRTLEESQQDRDLVKERLAALDAREHRVAGLEDRERELAAGAATLAAREVVLETAQEELEAERTRLEDERSSLAAARDAVESQRDELRRAVTNVSAGLGLGGAGLAPADGGATGHLLLVGGDRYRLLESDGAAPAANEMVELEGATYRVLRVGGSPLPGDSRRCAVLERYSSSGSR